MKKGGIELKKSENSSGIWKNVLLGVLVVLALAFLLLLKFGPAYAAKMAEKDSDEVSYLEETAMAREDQRPVDVYDMQGVSLHVTSGGTQQPLERAEAETPAAPLPTAAAPQGELPQTAAAQTAPPQAAPPTQAAIPETMGQAAPGQAVPGESAAADGDYILPESSTRYYTKEEISALDDQKLYLARNEIYAKLGRKFKSDELNQYFGKKSWYRPQYEPSVFDNKGDRVFNPYELANRNLIVSVEEERKGR